MLTFHPGILLNCCTLCILHGAARQTESVFKVAQAMCWSQLLFGEQRECCLFLVCPEEERVLRATLPPTTNFTEGVYGHPGNT